MSQPRDGGLPGRAHLITLWARVFREGTIVVYESVG